MIEPPYSAAAVRYDKMENRRAGKSGVQLRDNLKAMENLSFSPEELEAIDRISEPHWIRQHP